MSDLIQPLVQSSDYVTDSNDSDVKIIEQKQQRVRFSSAISDDDPEIYDLPKDMDVGRSVIKKLLWVSLFAFILMGAEITGGVLAGSLAIMTDAAHMFSDFCGFFISIASIQIGKRPSTITHSYGYHRAEIIGALVSVVLIWGLTLWLVVEAFDRITNQSFTLDGDVMLITAAFGLFSNLVMMKVLHGGHGHTHGGGGGHSHGGEGHGHSHGGNNKSKDKKRNKSKLHNKEDKCVNKNQLKDELEIQDIEKNVQGINKSINVLDIENKESINKKKDVKKSQNLSVISEANNPNMRAAMIHLIGDLVQSVGVLIAAVVIKYYPQYKLADPICTFVFSILVIFTTTNVVKDCIRVLMEAAPVGMNVQEFEQQLLALKYVKDVHDIHVWSLSHGKPSMSAHIFSSNPKITLRKATALCRSYGIYHSTIQVEDWHSKDEKGNIKCLQNLH